MVNQENNLEAQVTLLDGSKVYPSEVDLDNDSVYYGDLGKLALSSSSCKMLLESPKKYKYVTLYGDEGDSKPLVLGRLIHLMVLEPQRIDEECIFVDVKTRGTKAFKEAVEENSGRMVFTSVEKAQCDRVADALLQSEAVLELLNKSKTEIGILKELYGLPFRAKADIMKTNHIIDLKTTSNLAGFKYSADKYGYDLQAYLYTQLFEVEKFTFLVVDKSTLDIGIFETSPEFIARGKRKLEESIDIYNEWFRGGDLKEVDVTNYILKATL